VAEGSIIYQDPTGGENVEPGSAVDVTVSLGPELVEVPEVYGVTLAEAQQLVGNAGLNSTVLEVESQEVGGSALSTDPPAGTLLDPETTVTIYYSAGPPEFTPPPEPTTSPDTTSSPDSQGAPEPQISPEDEQEDRGNAGRGGSGNPADGPGSGGPGNVRPGNGGIGDGSRGDEPGGDRQDRRRGGGNR
jgi:serine/threonine-protein kinase